MTVPGASGSVLPNFNFPITTVPASRRPPAPDERPVEVSVQREDSGLAALTTERPGGFPFHAGGPGEVTVPRQSPGSLSVLLSARPVNSSAPSGTPNAVIQQAQTNSTEMVGLLLDRFA